MRYINIIIYDIYIVDEVYTYQYVNITYWYVHIREWGKYSMLKLNIIC